MNTPFTTLEPAHASTQFVFPANFRTQEIQTDGATIHVRVGGQGPAVVLLHGFGFTGDMWAPLAAELARDHRVVVPDHSVIACELGSQGSPHVTCKPESVKQHDRRALSADSDMNCRAVGLNVLSMEVGRKYELSTCVGSFERGEGCVHLFLSCLCSFVTTWLQHAPPHQRGCFRHSPWLPTADKARRPPSPRLQPVAESGAVFSGTRGRCSRASE